MQNRRGSVSLYIIMIVMLVTLVSTFFIRSITDDMISFKLEAKKLESDYIAQHGLTLVKEGLQKIILDKEDLSFASLPPNSTPYSKELKLPNDINVELEVISSINTWNEAKSLHELGPKTNVYKLRQNELAGGFNSFVYENYPQIQNTFNPLRGSNNLSFVENTSGFGQTGIIDISGSFNKTTMVSDFFMTNLNKNMEEIMFYAYRPVLNKNSFELIDTFNIKQFYKNNSYLPDIDGLKWNNEVNISTVYDDSLSVMKVYIAISRENAVDIFSYEPYLVETNKFTYLTTFSSPKKLNFIRLSGIYSKSINTVELLLTTVVDKKVSVYSFIPNLPSLGFDEVSKNTFDVDFINSIDADYIWSDDKSTGILVYGIVTEKNGAENLSFYENYPYISTSVKKIFDIDRSWSVFSGSLDLYNVSLGLIYNESVGSNTLLVAVGDTKNNRITTHKAYLELGIWDSLSHKAIDLGINGGVGRLSLAGIGGDFSQAILVNPQPIVEEVTYDINNVTITGNSYNKDNILSSITKYIPTIKLVYEEPEYRGDRKILSYEITKIIKK